jgi:glycosyltransferase involved in cell wall biosynthesis
MRIVVNTRFLIKDRLEGIGWFTFETFKRITASHPEHEFVFLFDRPYSEEFIFSKNITPVVLFPPARHPLLWTIWFEWSVRRFLKKTKPDVFISADGFLSLRAKTTSVAVIHDINFEHRPYDLPILARAYYRYFFPKFARKATRIITVSDFSKKDICQTYHISGSLIDVVYNGANPIYTPLTEDKINETRVQYTHGSKYFIFIGSLHPRKNIVGLLKAFDAFKTKTGLEHKLVIVGERMFDSGHYQIVFNSLKYKKEVVFTGRLLPEDLHLLLGSADALVFVPFYEGFGIPVIEAFNCDIPVVASNVTSIPEIAGEAAILVDPNFIENITEGMEKIVMNDFLRKDLILKAREQRQKFSWDKTAQNLWDSIQKCI